MKKKMNNVLIKWTKLGSKVWINNSTLLTERERLVLSWVRDPKIPLFKGIWSLGLLGNASYSLSPMPSWLMASQTQLGSLHRQLDTLLRSDSSQKGMWAREKLCTENKKTCWFSPTQVQRKEGWRCGWLDCAFPLGLGVPEASSY